MLSRFPYYIYYRLLESGCLRILTVAHNRRRLSIGVAGNSVLTPYLSGYLVTLGLPPVPTLEHLSGVGGTLTDDETV